MCISKDLKCISEDLNSMTKGVQGPVTEGIFFFQPPKKMWVEGLWNMNKLFQGFCNMPVVLQVPLYGPQVRQPGGTCFSILDSRPIGEMKWLTEQFVLTRRELIFKPRASPSLWWV